MGIPSAAQVMDNYDFDKIVRTRHRLVGASDLQMKNREDVEETRAEREEAQRAAQEQQAKAAQAEVELQQQKAAAQSSRAAESEMKARVLGGDLIASMGGYQ